MHQLLAKDLDGVEKDFDLTIELEGYTKADIPDLELNGITILYGVVPNKPTGRTRQRATKTKTHRQKDSQSKLMSRKLADIIQQDASIVRRAKDHIDRLLMEDQGMAYDEDEGQHGKDCMVRSNFRHPTPNSALAVI
jgi:hypothetical protein